MTPTIDDVRAAARRIAPEAIRTPLISNPLLDEAVGGHVLLKCENLQRTGSFKFRGAYNAVTSLGPEARARGIVALSSGNHAQGVAAAARIFGAAATIVMPDDAPAAKRLGTEKLGAKVVTYRRIDEDRDAIGAALVAKTGAALVHPYNDGHVIAGQGTIGLEIAEDLAARGIAADALIVPCGGGGMSSGIVLAVEAAMPATKLYLAEPQGFDDYARSLAAGEIRPNERSQGSVCDALMAKQPGAIGFSINRRIVSGAVAVSDDEVLQAVAFAFALRLVVEPGGAAALAAILSGRFEARGKTVVVVLSGGNIDPDMLAQALGRN